MSMSIGMMNNFAVKRPAVSPFGEFGMNSNAQNNNDVSIFANKEPEGAKGLQNPEKKDEKGSIMELLMQLMSALSQQGGAQDAQQQMQQPQQAAPQGAAGVEGAKGANAENPIKQMINQLLSMLGMGEEEQQQGEEMNPFAMAEQNQMPAAPNPFAANDDIFADAPAKMGKKPAFAM